MTGQAQQNNIEDLLEESYSEDLDDRYIEPTVIDEKSSIQDGDSLIFFNFREDSAAQIGRVFGEEGFDEFQIKGFDDLFVTTMTNYDTRISAEVAFSRERVKNTLGEVLEKNDKLQMRVAETEKESHVTYFFNGFRQEAFENEYRILIPSDKTANPANNPQMRAKDITDRVILSLGEGNFSFILVNFANPDFLAHTGNYQATVQAIEFIDKQLGKLVDSVLKNDDTLIITSDHGNAEEVFDPKTGKVETKHDSNPVPLYVIDNEYKRERSRKSRLPQFGMLSDVAPTVLDFMNIEKPGQMTGSSLRDLF